MNMIFFKAEANKEIGGGHLHRAISIAKKIKEYGVEVRFIFSETSKLFIEKVSSAGFELFLIKKEDQYNPNVYLNLIPRYSLIIFDTDEPLFYSGHLIDTLKKNNLKTACFTVTDKYKIATDLLINPNIISKEHNYNTADYTRPLLGPQYLLFRDEFKNIIPPSERNLNTPITLLLIFGNSDSSHLTLHFLKIVLSLSHSIKKIFIVCGPLNADIKKIRSVAQSQNIIETELFVDVPNLVPIYEQVDVAITSAGMAMWEMALFNIKQFVFASSQREIQYTNYLHRLNFIFKLGEVPIQTNKIHLQNQISNLISNEEMGKLETDEFRRILNPFDLNGLIDVLLDEIRS